MQKKKFHRSVRGGYYTALSYVMNSWCNSFVYICLSESWAKLKEVGTHSNQRRLNVLQNSPIHSSVLFLRLQCFLPSVLWRCWLGGRKGIRPVKNEWWGVGVIVCLERGASCIWPSWCHCHSLSLAPVKSRLVLPFWYRLTQVVLEKRPLNGCSSWYEQVCIVRFRIFKVKFNLEKWPGV